MDEVDLKTEGRFSVTIAKSHATLKDRITYYRVDCTSPDNKSSFVVRFKEIADFRVALSTSLPLANQLPRFPATKGFGFSKLINLDHLSASFVDARAKEANEFFADLWSLPNISSKPLVYKFMKFPQEEANAQSLLDTMKKSMGKDSPECATITVPEAKTEGGITFYTVVLTLPNADIKSLRRRFKDFQNLHAQLRLNYGNGRSAHLLKNFPEFPPGAFKLFTDHTTPEFIDNRRLLLERFVNGVLQLPYAAEDVHLLAFLDMWAGYEPCTEGPLGV